MAVFPSLLPLSPPNSRTPVPLRPPLEPLEPCKSPVYHVVPERDTLGKEFLHFLLEILHGFPRHVDRLSPAPDGRRPLLTRNDGAALVQRGHLLVDAGRVEIPEHESRVLSGPNGVPLARFPHSLPNGHGGTLGYTFGFRFRCATFRAMCFREVPVELAVRKIGLPAFLHLREVGQDGHRPLGFPRLQVTQPVVVRPVLLPGTVPQHLGLLSIEDGVSQKQGGPFLEVGEYSSSVSG